MKEQELGFLEYRALKNLILIWGLSLPFIGNPSIIEDAREARKMSMSA